MNHPIAFTAFSVPGDPADGLDGSQAPRDHHRLATVVADDLPGQRVACSLDPASLPYIESDSIRPSGRCRVQVDVVGDQEVSCPDSRCAGGGVERRRSVIGLPLRILKLLGKTFVLASTDVREIPAACIMGSVLVAVDGNAQLCSYALGQGACQDDGLLHRDARDRDKWAHIRSAEARVLPLVKAHIDELCRTADAVERGFEDLGRLADESHHCAIGARARIDVENLDVGCRLYRFANGRYDTWPPPFAEIGYALENLIAHCTAENTASGAASGA